MSDVDLSKCSLEDLQATIKKMKAEKPTTQAPAQQQEQQATTKQEKKMSDVDLSQFSAEELQAALEKKKAEEEDAREEQEAEKAVDLNTLTDEELEKVLKKRKAQAAELAKNKPQLRTVSMEEAFKLAKESGLDGMFSVRSGNKNVDWIRWIADNSLNLTPFVTWIDDEGRKKKTPPRRDKDGFYNGSGKITLICDGEAIEKGISAGDDLRLFELVIKHCG